jgi:hypothetical protein
MRTTDPRSRLLVAVTAAALAVVAVIAPVSAATPQSVSIVARTYFSDYYPDSFFGGAFDAAGAAVTSGLICGSGHHNDIDDRVHGYQSGAKLQIQNHGAYVCPDGTILLKIQFHSHVDFSIGETFTWVVEGGTGAYARLRGGGGGYTLEGTDANGQYYHEGYLTGFLIV